MVKKCPSCGGEDHARASSNKCLNRKRKVREEVIPPTHELRPYTIKKCFRGFVRPDKDDTGVKELLVKEVRRDVRDLSDLAIEVSLSIAFFYSHYLTRLGGSQFLLAYPKCNAARFVSALKDNGGRKKTTPFLEDPDDVLASYMSLRLKPDLKYDGVWRNALCTYIAKRYETELETAITTHAFKRIRRFLTYQRCMGKEQGLTKETRKAIHDACFARYYGNNTPPIKKTEESDWINDWFNANEI